MAPAREHRATVIWLHGLGADGHDFEPIIPALRLPEALGVRFLFPEAPIRAVTLNGGAHMRSWYDIRSLDREGHLNLEQLADSVAGVRALLEGEHARGIPPERTVLAGFSQGGAVALHLAVCPGPNLEAPPRLAGLLALSTYLARAESVIPPPGHLFPIFQGHGTYDPMVPPELGAFSRQVLEAAGWDVESHSYPMAHQVIQAEIQDIGQFLRRVLRDPENAEGPAR